jgi:hypothetical protein
MRFKISMQEYLSKNRFDWFALIVLDVFALAGYLFLSLRLLMNPSPLFITTCWLAPEEMFLFNTLFLLLSLFFWSALAWRLSQRISVKLPLRIRRANAFKYNAIVIFPMLILWFYLLLAFIIAVELPSLERWFVAMALAWMITPFTTLGFLFAGARLGSMLER